MTRRVGIVCLIVWILSLGGTQARAQESTLLGPLKAQWENIRTQVVRTAEAVPEDKYAFKPTPEVRSFLDLFIHIAEENYFFMGFVTGDRSGDPNRFKNLKTRAEIVKALNESYDYGAKALAGLNDQKAMEMVPMMGGRQGPRWSAALANIADNMDHYGNLVVYMRLNGIVPPSTAARQQRQR